jgi:2-(1,2-epoxy-1,2-dihydrophenyl)acetyl-CoA isomerase
MDTGGGAKPESELLSPISSPVAITLSDGVAWITLNDAPRGNPLTLDGTRRLFDAVRAAQSHRAQVVVVNAAGRSFCVGGDIRAFGDAADQSRYIDDLADILHRVISEIRHMDAVVIAAVQGTAAGAGMPLAASADIVLAAESAAFTLGYTKIGLTPDGGSSLLTSTLGLHRSLYLALLNPVVTAAQAKEFGLVAEVVPDGSLTARTAEVASQLASGSRHAQATAKRLLRNHAEPNSDTALREEALAVRVAAAAPDSHEGVRAFLEKRSPAFGTGPAVPS